MKGMDVLNTSTDLLYSLEQVKAGRPVDGEELAVRLGLGQDLLTRLLDAASSQTSKTARHDLFMLTIAEQVEKKLALRPSELQLRLRQAVKDLQNQQPTPATVQILETVTDVVAGITLRSVEGLSTSLL